MIPEPKPSSRGRCVDEIPVCSTNSDDYPWGDPERSREDDLREVEEAWGSLAFAENFAPRGDRRFAEWWAAYQRAGAGPSAAAALGRANWEIDIRPLLSAIRAPTLVLSRRGDPIGPPDAARYMAEQIPGGRFVELEGDDHILWLGDVEALCGEIEQFITGIRPARPEPGAVTTILQCDVESSAMRAGPTCSAVTVASPTSRLPPEQGGSSTAPATG